MEVFCFFTDSKEVIFNVCKAVKKQSQQTNESKRLPKGRETFYRCKSAAQLTVSNIKIFYMLSIIVLDLIFACAAALVFSN